MNLPISLKWGGLVMIFISILTSCKKDAGTNLQLITELAKPEAVTTQPESDKVVVSWNPVEGADGYAVDLAKGSAFSTSAIIAKSDTIKETTYKFEGLTPRTAYTIRLRAISLKSPSATSKSQTFNFLTAAPPVTNIKADAVVAKDGSGNYTTVQAAIDAAPSNRTSFYYIYVKKGEYKEVIEISQSKPFIYLVGEDKAQTILTYDNHAGKAKPGGGTFGTADSRSFYVKGNNFVAENISFANTAGMNAGQAVALYIDALSSAFRNCRFLGFQDTWYAHNGTSQYIKNCYIEGSVDFMFGGSKTLFDSCQIHSNRTGGYLTAASTDAGQEYGYVFNKCKLTADAGISSVFLGRPWRPNANVVYISCEMGSHIKAEGWNNWSNPDNEKTAYYAEYKSTGAGANPGSRVSWSRQLTDAEAAKYTFAKMFGTWDPGFLADNVQVVP